MFHHNNLCDRVAYLSSKALTTTHVRNNPLINSGRSGQTGKALMDNPPRNSPGKAIDLEKKGDLMIWDLWARGTDCTLYMLVLNTYAA